MYVLGVGWYSIHHKLNILNFMVCQITKLKSLPNFYVSHAVAAIAAVGLRILVEDAMQIYLKLSQCHNQLVHRFNLLE